MSRVKFNGTVVPALRNALKLNRYRKAAYEYRWDQSVDHLFPEHYKQRCEEFMRRLPKPVHYKPAESKWKISPETDRWEVNNDEPVYVVYPEQCNDGLWGGEGIVQGEYIARWKRKRSLEFPKIWRPSLIRRIFYSEILDKWYHVVVTPRTLDLIDEANGFDNYILKTHERDLNSKLGMNFKRAMLLSLVRQDMFPEDPEKKQKICDKYKEFIIPEEEAEWLGLSIKEAIKKGKQLQEENNPQIPLKYSLTKVLALRLQEISQNKDQDSAVDEGLTNKFKKLNPFSKSDDKRS
ncbi:large ribosomal subunit protein bL28m-like [Mytilus trossulus]|uniref:large ribosomal subunit protein bL28m-like n=1 Tax=Mytilus trossulus TaxID=6551 RepID=UPI003005D1CD